jgi:hypothetical protein
MSPRSELSLGEWPRPGEFHRVSMLEVARRRAPPAAPVATERPARVRGRVVALSTSAEPRAGTPTVWWAVEARIGGFCARKLGLVVERGHDFLVAEGAGEPVKVLAEGGHLAGLVCCQASMQPITERRHFSWPRRLTPTLVFNDPEIERQLRSRERAQRRVIRRMWGEAGPPPWLPEVDRNLMETIAGGRRLHVACVGIAPGDTVEVAGVLDRVVDPAGTRGHPRDVPLTTVIRNALVTRSAL